MLVAETAEPLEVSLGGRTPPAPWTGSVSTAAIWSPCSANTDAPASRSSAGRFTIPSTNGPYPSWFPGSPCADSPPYVTPWYRVTG